MATAKDGSLTFDTKFSTAEFEKGVKSIETLLGKVAVNLVGKMGQAGRETEKTVSTAAEGAAKEAGKSVASASSLITGFLKNDLITAGVSFMLDFVDQGIGMASQMQMVQQQVNATFGKEAGTLNGWAQDASNSYGLSEQAAKGYANEVGKTLKKAAKSDKDVAKMSKGIVGLSVDMASFYQLDHKEVLTALEKAVSGDAAALDKMGISMGDTELQAFALSEGITKSYGEMSEAEKVALRYDYVMAQTAQAQGAFAESSGTHSSQMQIFQANVQNLATGLGNVLLPAVNWALTGLNSLFGYNPGPKSELEQSIENARQDLDAVKTSIKDIKTDYNKTMVEIEVKYNKSNELLTELQALQDLKTTRPLTEEESQRILQIYDTLKEMFPDLKNISNMKAELYKFQEMEIKGLLSDDDRQKMEALRTTLEQMDPELVKIFGADGTFDVGAGMLRTLTDDWKKLDQQIAMSSMVTQIQAQQMGMDVQVKTYKQMYDDAYAQWTAEKNKLAFVDEGAKMLFDPFVDIESAEGIQNVQELYRTFAEQYKDEWNAMDFSGVDNIYDLMYKTNPEAIVGDEQLLEQLGKVRSILWDELQKMSIEGGEREKTLSAAAVESLDIYNAALEQYQAGSKELTAMQTVALKEFKGMTDQSIANAAHDGETLQQTVERLYKELITTADNGTTDLEDAGNDQGELVDGMGDTKNDAKDITDETDKLAGEQNAAIGELEAQALTVEQLAANIQVAQEAGATAQADLAARKETVVADAQAILTSMNDLIAALALDVDTMVTTMNTIVTNGEVGAATAGNAFAQGAGDGYRANTALRDAVGASAQQSLAALNSYANAFETAGSGLVGSIASGVTGNASALSDAVRDAVRGALAAAQSAFSGNSVFRTASRYYPHRTGLEYVPYDEYPALLHKGESVLTASEAALWRGGLYVREPGAARVDYDALAAAIWRGAPPEGGLAISVNLDGEEVANVLEPSISALQGRRLALQRR